MANNKERHEFRFDPALYESMLKHADRDHISATEWLMQAIAHYIDFENKDYDLPPAEIQRLNQLVDATNKLTSQISSLEHVSTSGFQAILRFTHGDNYLSDANNDGNSDK